MATTGLTFIPSQKFPDDTKKEELCKTVCFALNSENFKASLPAFDSKGEVTASPSDSSDACHEKFCSNPNQISPPNGINEVQESQSDGTLAGVFSETRCCITTYAEASEKLLKMTFLECYTALQLLPLPSGTVMVELEPFFSPISLMSYSFYALCDEARLSQQLPPRMMIGLPIGLFNDQDMCADRKEMEAAENRFTDAINKFIKHFQAILRKYPLMGLNIDKIIFLMERRFEHSFSTFHICYTFCLAALFIFICTARANIPEMLLSSVSKRISNGKKILKKSSSLRAGPPATREFAYHDADDKPEANSTCGAQECSFDDSEERLANRGKSSSLGGISSANRLIPSKRKGTNTFLANGKVQKVGAMASGKGRYQKHKMELLEPIDPSIENASRLNVDESDVGVDAINQLIPSLLEKHQGSFENLGRVRNQSFRKVKRRLKKQTEGADIIQKGLKDLSNNRERKDRDFLSPLKTVRAKNTTQTWRKIRRTSAAARIVKKDVSAYVCSASSPPISAETEESHGESCSASLLKGHEHFSLSNCLLSTASATFPSISGYSHQVLPAQTSAPPGTEETPSLEPLPGQIFEQIAASGSCEFPLPRSQPKHLLCISHRARKRPLRNISLAQDPASQAFPVEFKSSGSRTHLLPTNLQQPHLEDNAATFLREASSARTLPILKGRSRTNTLRTKNSNSAVIGREGSNDSHDCNSYFPLNAAYFDAATHRHNQSTKIAADKKLRKLKGLLVKPAKGYSNEISSAHPLDMCVLQQNQEVLREQSASSEAKPVPYNLTSLVDGALNEALLHSEANDKTTSATLALNLEGASELSALPSCEGGAIGLDNGTLQQEQEVPGNNPSEKDATSSISVFSIFPGDIVHGKVISGKRPTRHPWFEERLLQFVNGNHRDTTVEMVLSFISNYAKSHSLPRFRNYYLCDETLQDLLKTKTFPLNRAKLLKLMKIRKLYADCEFWPDEILGVVNDNPDLITR